MSRQKIISHIWMWSLVGAGVSLAFLFISPKIIFSPNSTVTLVMTAILAVFFLYHFIKSISLHFNKKLISQKESGLVAAGVYGKFAHPTCTSVIILFWIFFLFYPDLRFFISNIWITASVISWIEIEKSAYRKKQKGRQELDSAP